MQTHFQENLKYIRLNAKQCAIYKVLLNGKHEASFQYFDPTLDIVQGVSHQHDVETYSDVHVKGNIKFFTLLSKMVLHILSSQLPKVVFINLSF